MWNPFKKPPPPPPEPVSLGEEAIALFIVVGLAWLIKKIRDEKHLDITSMLHYVGDMCEVATYSFCYFLFAMYFGGVVEDIMPHYAKHTTYWCLWLEVLGTAMLNSIVSQMTIDLMKRMPVPDLGFHGKTLAAKNGGIIFGMSLFARQNQFKKKVAALAAVDDTLFHYGFPAKVLNLLHF